MTSRRDVTTRRTARNVIERAVRMVGPDRVFAPPRTMAEPSRGRTTFVFGELSGDAKRQLAGTINGLLNAADFLGVSDIQQSSTLADVLRVLDLRLKTNPVLYKCANPASVHYFPALGNGRCLFDSTKLTKV